MSNEEKQLEEKYQSDLRDLVETYQAIRKVSKWIAALFAFLLVVASLILAAKKLL